MYLGAKVDSCPTQYQQDTAPIIGIDCMEYRLHDFPATRERNHGSEDHLRYAGLVILCILFLSPTGCSMYSVFRTTISSVYSVAPGDAEIAISGNIKQDTCLVDKQDDIVLGT